MEYFVNRLKEPSTYQGITILLGVFGIILDPTAIQSIGLGVVSTIGLVKTFFPDKIAQ